MRDQLSLRRRTITQITTGAPKIAVTALILISVGAKTVRAMRSQNRQKTDPPRKHAGMIRIGFAVFIICRD